MDRRDFLQNTCPTITFAFFGLSYIQACSKGDDSVDNQSNVVNNSNGNASNGVSVNGNIITVDLSNASFSGLSTALNNVSGIEFAYGKLSYKVNEDAYSDINAFAVNDGIGLVVKGNIDRKNKQLNLGGQISPIYLISGIIQKIPFFGKILIGNEGDGILAVEYSMIGDQDNPLVTSNPLTIFKPRLFQRTIDFFNNNNND